MMKNNKLINSLLILIAIPVSFFLGKLVVLPYKDWSDVHFNCDANFAVIKKDKRLSIIISYNFTGDYGIATMKGILKENDNSYSVSRKSYFSIKRTSNLYSLYSKEISISPADNTPEEQLLDMLPQFYIQSQKRLDFSIYPDGDNGLIFTTGYIPSFLCKKTDG